jgi:Phosphotransferase enzyme family
LEIRGMRNIGVPAELARLLPEFRETTGCGDWLVTRGHLNRRDCAIYFLGSRKYRIPQVVIKVWRNNPAKNRANDIHKKSLKYYHAATGRFTIPEPLFPFSSGDALAMECIAAPLCGTLLAKGFHRRVTRESVIRNAGGWLAWFHEQKGISNAPFDGTAAFRKITGIVEKIRHDSTLAIRDTWLLDHLKIAESCAGATDGLMLPHAVWHGDFTPFNLFMRGDSVTGFDFQVKRRFPVTHDICRFLLYLDVHRIFPASAAELRNSGCRERDREIFMQAYGRDRVPEENGLWLKLYFLEVMRRIATLTLAGLKGRTRLFRMQEMVRLRRNAGHISVAIS